MVWQALDTDGEVSNSFITTDTLNEKSYLEECIKKRLVPFIKKHYKNNNIILWPDNLPLQNRCCDVFGKEKYIFC